MMKKMLFGRAKKGPVSSPKLIKNYQEFEALWPCLEVVVFKKEDGFRHQCPTCGERYRCFVINRKKFRCIKCKKSYSLRMANPLEQILESERCSGQ